MTYRKCHQLQICLLTYIQLLCRTTGFFPTSIGQLLVQIPILLKHVCLAPMSLYRIHSIPMPTEADR